MIEVWKTKKYIKWINGLQDERAKTKISTRIKRLVSGNPGDSKYIREGVYELRITHGPGYRVYYKKAGKIIIILLVGGDKGTQRNDIKLALLLAKEEIGDIKC
jgi:putative addiction module killer protein